jgi:hypothetical protein
MKNLNLDQKLTAIKSIQKARNSELKDLENFYNEIFVSLIVEDFETLQQLEEKVEYLEIDTSPEL